MYDWHRLRGIIVESKNPQNLVFVAEELEIEVTPNSSVSLAWS